MDLVRKEYGIKCFVHIALQIIPELDMEFFFFLLSCFEYSLVFYLVLDDS